MAWWDDIWLNEGFATWLERRPMQESKPEWNGALDEVRDTQRAMGLDALRATRPVRTKVETPDEINQVFDAMAYQKTAAVIRMVEGYVGRASYRDGINAYVKKFAFANATGEGFWTTLAAVAEETRRSSTGELHYARQHAAREGRSAVYRRRVPSSCCHSGRSRRPCPHPRCGTFRCATSAIAVEKCSATRVCCFQRARRRQNSTAVRRGSSPTSKAAVITARRMTLKPFGALGEAARTGQPDGTRADHASRRSLGARSARRAEHRGFPVPVRSAGHERIQSCDCQRAVPRQLHR